jgi:hypothetical protein
MHTALVLWYSKWIYSRLLSIDWKFDINTPTLFLMGKWFHIKLHCYIKSAPAHLPFREFSVPCKFWRHVPYQGLISCHQWGIYQLLNVPFELQRTGYFILQSKVAKHYLDQGFCNSLFDAAVNDLYTVRLHSLVLGHRLTSLSDISTWCRERVVVPELSKNHSTLIFTNKLSISSSTAWLWSWRH